MKKGYRSTVALLLALCMIIGYGFSIDGAYAAGSKKATPKVKSVALNHKVYTVKKGKTVKLKATVLPKKASKKDKKVTWTSSKKKIASVKNGKVKGLKKGKTVITAKAKGKKAKCTVYVGTPVKKATFSSKSVSIIAGKTLSMPAKLSPAKPTVKKIIYSSDNEEVAKVDAKGNITAVTAGTAKITAKPQDEAGKAATLTVSVKPATEGEASTEAELNKLLADSNIKKVTIKSSDSLSMNIGSKDNPIDRGDVELVIDAPKGHIENYSKFKSVRIESIGASTYVEHYMGSVISYAATSGTVKIAEDGSAEIAVVSGAENLKLISDGSVTNLSINVKVSVQIEGATKNVIPVNVSAAATSSSLITCKELNIKTEVKISIDIQPGAEKTEVSLKGTSSDAEADRIMPDVSGLGIICIRRDNDYYNNLVAKNEGSSVSQTVNIEGSVEGTDAAPLAGAKISVIPFEREMTNAEVAAAASKAVYTATTNANGAYSIANVKIGNYYLLAQKDGFAAETAKLVLTSNDSGRHVAGVLTLNAQANASRKGTLSGRITDALTGGAAEQGLTLRLRKGGDNTSGAVLETANTDAEGNYSFSGRYEFGQYTVEIVDNRGDTNKYYAATYFNAVINRDGANIVNSKASPTVESDQVRFVLTWGDEESGASADLDSHLIGPKADGKDVFHTWYSDMAYSDTDTLTESADYVRHADLDVDDTDWEGPETTTIYRATNGVYSFYIHDYTNRENNQSDQMSRSKARVEVYKGSRKIAGPYNIPSTTKGILWHVCDYDSVSGKVTEVNNVLSNWAGEPNEVGMSQENLLRSAAGRLNDKIAEAKEILAKMDASDIKTRGSEAIAAAEKAAGGSDVQAMRDAQVGLEEWIDSINEAFYISEVRTEIADSDPDSTDYINLVDYYDTRSIYDEDEDGYETFLYDTLTIYGMEEGLSYDDIKFEFDNSSVKWTLETLKSGDPAGFDRKLTATFAGQSRTWYVKQEISRHIKMGFDILDEHGNTVDWRWADTYDENDEYIEAYEVRGYTSRIPSYTVKPRYSKSNAVIENSDRSEFDRKITVTCGDEKVVTYLKYVKEELYDGALSVMDIYKDGSYFDTWHTNDDEIEIYVWEDETPDYDSFTFIPSMEYEGAIAEFVLVNDSEYDGTLTIRLGDYSKVYNVKHTYTEESW